MSGAYFSSARQARFDWHVQPDVSVSVQVSLTTSVPIAGSNLMIASPFAS